jgi:hypothetical protein
MYSKPNFIALTLLVSVMTLWAACIATAQTLKSMRRLPDTGQTQSFTNIPGEDADFAINPPFFIQHGDGTVTDTVTGLMWQQADGGEMTVENAAIFCQNLTLGGYDDWRLPTAQEAYSILNQGKSNPALDVAIFANTGAEYWWTSEYDATNANKIWVTNKGGGIGNHLKTETISAGGTKKIHVRAVRDVATPATVSSHFTDNINGTVTDNLTNLIWAKTPAPDSMTWENALLFAENLSLAGQGDWRLPNIKELKSLTEASLANPSVNTNFFPEIGMKKYWSGTTLQNQTTRAWHLDTRFGITTYTEKTGKLNLICVRGGSGDLVKTDDLLMTALPILAFPNPFFDHIFLKNAPPDAVFEIYTTAGQVIFFGKNLEQTDFSGLPAGSYFLKISGQNTAALRLTKL